MTTAKAPVVGAAIMCLLLVSAVATWWSPWSPPSQCQAAWSGPCARDSLAQGPRFVLGDAAAIRRARAGAARVEELQDGVEEGTEESVILAVDHVFPLNCYWFAR